MKVAVIGAGIAGVTTAWELALAGHEVVVLERRTGVAEEASFAPTGLASAALAVPWAAPPSAWKAALGRAGGASASPLWRWRQARNRRPDSWQAGAAALARLIARSAARAEEIPSALRFECERASGLLVLLSQGDDLAVARGNVDWLCAQGVAARWLDADAVRGVEPSLAVRTSLAGAVHVADARQTNAREFVQGVRVAAKARGVRFVLGREVVALAPGAPSLVRLAPASPHPAGPATRGSAATASRLPAPASSFSAPSSYSTLGPRSVDDGDETLVGDVLECDAIVVCANLGARALLAPLGLNLPVAALPGTSVTVTLHAHEAHRDPGPTGSVFDARTGIALCRQGARVRVAGGFDATAGTRAPTGEEAAQALYRSLDRWFPGAARWPSAQLWHGERATLPDGLPLIGAGKRPGLYLNLAHGHHGWGVACGAAQALAALVSGREPPVDLAAFAPARLG
jgi:D-amino-acid dehydrogenase